MNSPQTRFPLQGLRPLLDKAWRSAKAFTHNTMAVVGLVVATLAVMVLTPTDLRQQAEQHVLRWLSERDLFVPTLSADSSAVERVTAVDPAALPVEQARLAEWLGRKYRVAPQPVAALVAEAYAVSGSLRLDPTLILAVMAVESGFNPFAASPVGAHGLMQVMSRVHSDKFEDFGGQMAAFDPLSNLRVGAQVLRETILRAGSTEGGLRLYLGAVSADASDYINKVLSEHERLQRVAGGQRVGFNAFQRQAPAAAAPNEPPAVETDALAKPVAAGVSAS